MWNMVGYNGSLLNDYMIYNVEEVVFRTMENCFILAISYTIRHSHLMTI